MPQQGASTRSGGVVLTMEALKRLENAVARWWQEAPEEVREIYPRLTRDAMADKLGCNVQTVDRIMKRSGGVHPSTLQTAFFRVGLTWNPDCCVRARSTTDADIEDRGLAVVRSQSSPIATGNGQKPSSIPSDRRGNLPQFLPRLIGRQEELDALEPLLEHRLLTVLGPGGIGKTHLALHLALRVAGRYPEGAYLVRLETLTEPSLIPQAITTVLELTDPSPAPDTLYTHLRSSKLLLVLDNCEHLATACAHLIETLLCHCPNLHILATSRETIGVAGEYRQELAPLAFPESQREYAPEALQASAAVQLFLERSGLKLTPANTQAIAQLSRRLEGVPLAIELAATHADVLSPAQILAELEPRLALLREEPSWRPERHRSLQAAVQWSYDLLSKEDQWLLRSLAVFRDGWTEEAAQALCPALSVRNGLKRLRHGSLISAGDMRGDMRFRMLETIREFAQEQQTAEEQETLKERHWSYYVAWTAEAEAHLNTPEELPWRHRFVPEQANLREALVWELHHAASPQLLVRESLGRFWVARIPPGPVYHWLRLVLPPEEQVSPAVYVQAQRRLGGLATYLGLWNEAELHLKTAIERYHKAQNREGVYAIYGLLGCLEEFRGNIPAAYKYARRCLRLLQELGLLERLAPTLNALAYQAVLLKDYSAAQAYLEKALAVAVQQNDGRSRACTENYFGELSMAREDYATALMWYRKALQSYQELALHTAVSSLWNDIGRAFACLRRYTESREAHRKALRMAREQELPDTGYNTVGFVHLALAEGKFEEAARLLGATEAIHRHHQHQAVSSHFERLKARAQETLPDTFDACWDEGILLASDWHALLASLLED